MYEIHIFFSCYPSECQIENSASTDFDEIDFVDTGIYISMSSKFMKFILTISIQGFTDFMIQL